MTLGLMNKICLLDRIEVAIVLFFVALLIFFLCFKLILVLEELFVVE